MVGGRIQDDVWHHKLFKCQRLSNVASLCLGYHSSLPVQSSTSNVALLPLTGGGFKPAYIPSVPSLLPANSPPLPVLCWLARMNPLLRVTVYSCFTSVSLAASPFATGGTVPPFFNTSYVLEPLETGIGRFGLREPRDTTLQQLNLAGSLFTLHHARADGILACGKINVPQGRTVDNTVGVSTLNIVIFCLC